MIDLDLSNPINQVRVLIGDVNSENISDSNIQFLLTKHNNNVLLAACEALDYILNMVAYYAREEVGDVEVYWNNVYEQLYNRKKELEKELAYKNSGSLFTFGGTSRKEICRVKRNDDYVSPTRKDFQNILGRFNINLDDPYILERDDCLEGRYYNNGCGC